MGRSRKAPYGIASLLAAAVIALAVAAMPVRAQPAAVPPAGAASEEPAPAPAAEAPPVDAAPATDAPPATEAPAAAPLPEEPPPEIEALEDAQAAFAPSADLVAFRERELRVKLEMATREEQDASLLWPWVTAITGWSALLAGVAIGTGLVIACEEDSCTGPYWPTWLVIGGALVGSVGTLWLVIEHRDIAELRIRRQRIERLLEENRHGDAAARGPSRPLVLAYSGRFDL